MTVWVMRFQVVLEGLRENAAEGNYQCSRLVLTLMKNKGENPRWVTAVVLLGAVLMAVGAVIALVHPAMLVLPGDEINGAARIYAGYLVSRNLTIATFLLLALVLRARGMLNTLVLLVAWIQILDASVDGWEGRWMIVPGILVLAGMFLAAAVRLSGYPFWKAEAWRRG
jgi:hypothetical protein